MWIHVVGGYYLLKKTCYIAAYDVQANIGDKKEIEATIYFTNKITSMKWRRKVDGRYEDIIPNAEVSNDDGNNMQQTIPLNQSKYTVMHEKPATLTINDLKPEDAGMYILQIIYMNIRCVRFRQHYKLTINSR